MFTKFPVTTLTILFHYQPVCMIVNIADEISRLSRKASRSLHPVESPVQNIMKNAPCAPAPGYVRATQEA
jgi:hypothetical protein